MHVAANPVVGCQQALVDLGLGDVRLLAEFGDLRSRLLLDALQLALFHLQIGFPVGDDPFGLFQQRLLGLDSGRVLFETLFGQFDFELLILDLLGNGVELAVVAHVVLLLLIVADEDFGLVHLALTLFRQGVQLLDLAVDMLDTGVQTGQLIFQILYLQRKLAFDFVDFVDLRIDFLKLVQRDDLLFHREIVGIAALSA